MANACTRIWLKTEEKHISVSFAATCTKMSKKAFITLLPPTWGVKSEENGNAD
jgi:hypothetical protein